MNNFNRTVAIFNLIIVIIGLFIGIREISLMKYDIEKDYDIAERSGAFDKGNPSLFFGYFELMPNRKTKIIYGSKPNKNRGRHISKLPFIVVNNGEKTVEKLKIGYFYQNKGKLAVSNSLNPINESARKIISRKAYLDEFLDYDLVNYEIPEQNPGYNISYNEIVTLIPTIYKIYFEQDSNVINEIYFEQRIDVYTSAKDIKAENYTLLLSKIEVNSLEELFVKFSENNLDKSSIDELENYYAIISFNKQKDEEIALIDEINSKNFKRVVLSKNKKMYLLIDNNGKVLSKKRRKAAHNKR